MYIIVNYLGGLGFAGQGHLGGPAAGHGHHQPHPHAAHALGGHPFFYPPPTPSADIQQQAAAMGSQGHPFQVIPCLDHLNETSGSTK